MIKNIITYGLISGIIISCWQVYSIAACYSRGDFDGNILLSYFIFILAFLLVFVAVRNYRDKYNDGIISFGKAFKTGLFTALLTSTIYAVVWVVDYYVFIPDFMDKYSAHVIHQTQNSGASAAEIAAKTKEINMMRKMYDTPVMVVLLTYMEVFPVGLIISVIAALVLKRKKKSGYKPEPV